MKTKQEISMVNNVLDMLEEEFQTLTAIEQGNIFGGSGGYSSGGYGSGGSVPISSVGGYEGFYYKQVWDPIIGVETPMVSFDQGQTWAQSDQSLNTSTAAQQPNGEYYFMQGNELGDQYFANLGGNSDAGFKEGFLHIMEDEEGGFQYTNNPSDNGGSTYAGITLNTFTGGGWADTFGLSSDANGLKSMTADQVATIYNDFWNNQTHAAQICNSDFAIEIFDLGFNGPANAGRAVQRALNHMGYSLTVDGAIGSQTINAINDAINEGNLNTLGSNFNNEMNSIYQQIVTNDPSQSIFLDGWNDRVDYYTW